MPSLFELKKYQNSLNSFNFYNSKILTEYEETICESNCRNNLLYFLGVYIFCLRDSPDNKVFKNIESILIKPRGGEVTKIEIDFEFILTTRNNLLQVFAAFIEKNICLNTNPIKNRCSIEKILFLYQDDYSQKNHILYEKLLFLSFLYDLKLYKTYNELDNKLCDYIEIGDKIYTKINNEYILNDLSIQEIMYLVNKIFKFTGLYKPRLYYNAEENFNNRIRYR